MERTIKISLILEHIGLNRDVLPLIKSYVFYDLDKAYRDHQKIFNHTLLILHLCLSRNTGFINPNTGFLPKRENEILISNDTSEEWRLGLEFDPYLYHRHGFDFPKLQAINCSICGGYKDSGKKICESIKCIDHN